MDTKKSFSNIVLIFGILFAIIGIMLTLIQPIPADPKETSTMLLQFVGLFVFIGIPVYAVKYYRDQGYPVGIGSAIKLGVLVGLLGGLILGIYSYIYFTYINPDAVEQVLEVSKKVLEENEMFDPELMDEQMEMSKKMFAPLQFGGNLFSGLLYGVIGGLLGGLFFRTPQEDEY